MATPGGLLLEGGQRSTVVGVHMCSYLCLPTPPLLQQMPLQPRQSASCGGRGAVDGVGVT